MTRAVFRTRGRSEVAHVVCLGCGWEPKRITGKLPTATRQAKRHASECARHGRVAIDLGYSWFWQRVRP